MITLTVKGLKETINSFNKEQKQARFAAHRALNAAAFKAKKETESEITRVFDRPTPWIKRSVRYEKSTKENLTAHVNFDAYGNKSGVTADKILTAEIYGGRRKPKSFERALQRTGYLPDGWVAVPGKAVKLDQYGNVPGKTIVEILSYLSAFGEQGFKSNATAKTRAAKFKGRKGTRGYEYIILREKKGKLLPGIYKRKNYSSSESARVAHLQSGGMTPMFIFVNAAKYKRKFDFFGVAARAAQAEFERAFPGYLNEALRTAKP